jgi:hypothetical protein
MTRISQTNQRQPTSAAWMREGPRSGGASSSRPGVAGALQQLETRGARASQWLGLGSASGLSRLFGVTTDRFYKKELKQAEARVLPPGEKPAHKTKGVKFTPEQVERVRNAPDLATARKEVRGMLQRATGERGREAVNKLLGTNIREGRNKNKAGDNILDKIAGSIAKTLRRDVGGEHPAGGASPWSSTNTRSNAEIGASDAACHPPPPPPCVHEPVTVDIGEFVPAAKAASELMSPLVFDVGGAGLQLDRGARVPVDLDGDGQDEMVTDVDNGLGLLVFDAPEIDEDGRAGASRAFFGDGTDLTGYGVVSPRADGRWDDGFAALRALCEHLYLVGGDKQHLDAHDLAFLHNEIGLRMRTGGLYGDDVSLAELGVTRIDLGDAATVEPLEQAAKDRFGNKWMRQAGATFVIDGQLRCYADLWFAVTQRTTVAPSTTRTKSSTAPAAHRAPA